MNQDVTDFIEAVKEPWQGSSAPSCERLSTGRFQVFRNVYNTRNHIF